jgi:hypothetical protein
VIALDAAVRKILRGCNRPIGWVRRDLDPMGRVIDEAPIAPRTLPVVLPRALTEAEIALINTLAECRKAMTHLSEPAYQSAMAGTDDAETPEAARLVADGFLMWRTYEWSDRKGRRLEFTGLGFVARHLFLRRPEALADPRVDLGVGR